MQVLSVHVVIPFTYVVVFILNHAFKKYFKSEKRLKKLKNVKKY